MPNVWGKTLYTIRENRFYRFVLLTFALLTLGTLLWFQSSAYYTAFIAWLANGWLWFLGQSQWGRFVANGTQLLVYHQAIGVASPIQVAGFYAFFNQVVFLSLLLATPGLPRRRRVGFALLGAGLMVLVHLLTLYLNLRFTYLYSQQLAAPDQRTGLLIQAGQILTGAIGEQLFPILIWATLTLRYWLRDLAR